MWLLYRVVGAFLCGYCTAPMWLHYSSRVAHMWLLHRVVGAFLCGYCTAPMWLHYSSRVAHMWLLHRVVGAFLCGYCGALCGSHSSHVAPIQLTCGSHTGWWGHSRVATTQFSMWLLHSSHVATIQLLHDSHTAHVQLPYRVVGHSCVATVPPMEGTNHQSEILKLLSDVSSLIDWSKNLFGKLVNPDNVSITPRFDKPP